MSKMEAKKQSKISIAVDITQYKAIKREHKKHIDNFQQLLAEQQRKKKKESEKMMNISVSHTVGNVEKMLNKFSLPSKAPELPATIH